MAVPRMMLPGAPGGVALPEPLSPSDVVLVRRIFVAQSRGDMALASRATAELENPLLLGHILADRYLGPHHRSSVPELTDWLDRFGSQPDAAGIYALLLQRLPKGVAPPSAPVSTAMLTTPATVAGRHDDDDSSDEVPIQRNPALDHAVIAQAISGRNDAALRMIARQKGVDPGYRSLLRGEVARVLFTQNRDLDVLRVAAADARDTPADRQAALPRQMAGLAAWRLRQPELAADYFATAATAPVASMAQRAAGAFWAARAARRTGDPISAAYWLRQAAKYPTTFHGLIAQRALRLHAGIAVDRDTLSQADIDAIAATPQGLRAFALLQVGQRDRAETELRALWPATKIDPTLARALRLVASSAGLYDLAAQLAALTEVPPADGQAADGQHGVTPVRLPPLRPNGGFRIDPALVYALTRVESDFDNGCVSRAGARGLMQIMPDTARSVTGVMSLASDRLHDPGFNLALGQRYLVYLTTQDGIGSDLIRVLASYNSGPGGFMRWSGTIRDDDDPLLFIEAIPNTETRLFVRHALTYAWIYAARLGRPPLGLDALVAGEFPRFTDEAQPGTMTMMVPHIH
jgi:soluble lytic murein transglycosylase-like protein